VRSSDEIIISKVAPRAVDALRDRGPMQSPYRQGTDLKHDYKPEAMTLSLWQKIRLAPFVVQSLFGVLVKSPKTTITGIVGGVAYIVNAFFGVMIPQEAIIAVTLFVLGLFSQDAE
jgi:hypothetical protein